jgi:hypothetical protein
MHAIVFVALDCGRHELRDQVHFEGLHAVGLAKHFAAAPSFAADSPASTIQLAFSTSARAASILISLILDPQPTEYILDACAGSGTKTTHLGELMHNQGKIVEEGTTS